MATEKANPFGVARDFRKTHGEEAFAVLVQTAFSEADLDKSGFIDKSELRNTLKKLNIHIVGVTAAIMQKYDVDGSGEISEEEFTKLVSDLIDGTFEKEAAALAAAKDREKEKAAAAAAELALRNEVAALRAECAAQKKANETLKTQMTTLQKRVDTLTNIQASHDDKFRQMERRALEAEEMRALEHSIGMKAGVDPSALAGAAANDAAFKAMGSTTMDAARDILGSAKKPPMPSMPKQASTKKKGIFGL